MHQLVTVLAPGDAIGNSVFYIQNLLKNEGINTEIFAETILPDLTGNARHLGDYPSVDNEETILLAHYSIASTGMVTLPYFKARKIIFYHNVTPHHYWKDIDVLAAYHCLHGRAELTKVIPFMNYGIAFSEFSLSELKRHGLQNTARVPLPINLDLLKIPADPLTLKTYEKKKEKRILVVGRVVPNKMIEDAIRVASFLPDSRLIVAGHTSSLIYHHALLSLVANTKIKCEFTGHISQAELNALYQIADVLLVVSEHEGFCAPILEAFYFGLPVVAYASAAIPETAAGGALLFDRKDSEMIAELIRRVFSDSELRSQLQSEGTKVVHRYLEFPAKQTLLDIVKEVSTMSPKYKPRPADEM